jgi:colicin import membrane protein
MKTIYLKRSLWLAAILFTSLCAGAQTKTTAKTAYQVEDHDMYYRIYNEDGKRIEEIKTEYDGKIYKMEWVDGKVTGLIVDGEKIAEADWSKYTNAIEHVREEIKEQAKRDAEQAKRNAEQAIRNQEQAKRNEEQARLNAEQEKRNAEQAIRNQEQAKRNEEQVRLNADQQKRDAEQVIRNQEQEKKDAEQVIRNKEQEKRNAEQAIRNQEQEKKDAEQVIRNQEQAKRNAEQAIRNQEQAKRNEEQAKANEKMMKDITDDLVNDKIIPDTNSLHEIRLSEFGMSVNGVKQPDEVFKKYKEKYRKSSEGTFMYSRDGVIQGH